jgi:putative NADH-flavin reductase
MDIAVIGANGQIGQRIVEELLSRDHYVTAVVRNPEKFTLESDHLRVITGDVLDIDSIVAAVAGHEAVVSAIGPTHELGNNDIFQAAAHNLIIALKQANVKRLIVVGGAGSLEVSPGVRVVDTPAIPEAWREGVLGQAAALDIYREETELEWTYFSPAALIEPGERTGKFRLGGDQLVTDDAGNSKISIEDYAVALADELENRAYIRQRFTVAY